MKDSRPTGWRGVMNQGPRPSDFGLSPLADNVDSITQRQRVRVSRISHGIGGGMRVNEDADVFRCMPVSAHSRTQDSQLSLTQRRLVFGLYGAALACSLLIAHLHLRFEIHDINMQQHALQNIQRTLQREHSLLQTRHMAVTSDLGLLKDFAIYKMSMVENGRAPQLTVSSSLKEKYSEQGYQQEREEQKVEDLAFQNNKKKPLHRLADLAWAAIGNP